MKVYGFDDADVMQGELRAANVDAALMDFPEQLAASMDWEHGYPRFVEARAKLIERMKEEGVDKEMIDLVRTMKASFIPVAD